MTLKFWEPWKPKPGDRVQVRISPECPADHSHWAEAQGVGTMTDIGWDESVWGPEVESTEEEIRAMADEGEDPEAVLAGVRAYRGHNYNVTYDTPVWDSRAKRGIKHDLCAAIELELLEP